MTTTPSEDRATALEEQLASEKAAAAAEHIAHREEVERLRGALNRAAGQFEFAAQALSETLDHAGLGPALLATAKAARQALEPPHG